jgi:putative ABC transport system ATP-binding protein
MTLRASDVTRVFGKGPAAVTAVQDVSITLEAGEVVLLLGPSGSGKTTLVSILGGLLRPTGGTVFLDDKQIDTHDPSMPELRLRNIGFVFQTFNLLPALTVLLNVSLPLRLAGVRRREADRRAASILETLGLGNRLAARPDVLSGGEKQRVSIARALVGEPRVLLADEPTASLDTRNGREAITLLTRLAREGSQACLIVTHDQRLAEFSDRVLRIEDGVLTGG